MLGFSSPLSINEFGRSSFPEGGSEESGGECGNSEFYESECCESESGEGWESESEASDGGSLYLPTPERPRMVVCDQFQL